MESVVYDVTTLVSENRSAAHEVAAISQREARPLADLLTFGQALVDQGLHADTHLGLIGELKHPDEIRTFVRHFVEEGLKAEPPPHAQSLTRKQRTDGALEELRVASAQFGSAGTEALWQWALGQERGL